MIAHGAAGDPEGECGGHGGEESVLLGGVVEELDFGRVGVGVVEGPLVSDAGVSDGDGRSFPEIRGHTPEHDGSDEDHASEGQLGMLGWCVDAVAGDLERKLRTSVKI